ncbi:Rhbdl2 [Symbiodinium sp. CCMP2456]|nr:Rhbdl2 [Symbiodinium sp. CCMP2456]
MLSKLIKRRLTIPDWRWTMIRIPGCVGLLALERQVHLHTRMEPSALSRYYAWLPWQATSLSSPLTAWRLFSHSLGHGGWDHLQHNLMLLCLVGPPCERHYGSTAVFRVLICCSVAVAISHWTFGPRNAQIFGLSGNVFALITLNGFAGFTGRKALPATALLTMVLWLAGEIGPLLHGKADGISHASHLVGALFGSYCGYAVGQVPSRRSAFQELSGIQVNRCRACCGLRCRSGWNASAGDGEAREHPPRLSGA